MVLSRVERWSMHGGSAVFPRFLSANNYFLCSGDTQCNMLAQGG